MDYEGGSRVESRVSWQRTGAVFPIGRQSTGSCQAMANHAKLTREEIDAECPYI